MELLHTLFRSRSSRSLRRKWRTHCQRRRHHTTHPMRLRTNLCNKLAAAAQAQEVRLVVVGTLAELVAAVGAVARAVVKAALAAIVAEQVAVAPM